MGVKPKFFKKNKLNDSCTWTMTTASTSLAYVLYDREVSTKLSSTSLSDTVPEVWVATFPSSVTIQAILVLGHNIKSGDIKYWNGTAFVAFPTPFAWSANTASYTYGGVGTISTTKIQITMNTTIVSNSKKYISELYILELFGDPSISPESIDRELTEDSISLKLAGGGSYRAIFGQKMKLKYRFSNATTSDITFFNSLKLLYEPFLVYPCGGTSIETDYAFTPTDIYLMNYTNNFEPKFKSNVIGIGSIIDLTFEEV